MWAGVGIPHGLVGQHIVEDMALMILFLGSGGIESRECPLNMPGWSEAVLHSDATSILYILICGVMFSLGIQKARDVCVCV